MGKYTVFGEDLVVYDFATEKKTKKIKKKTCAIVFDRLFFLQKQNDVFAVFGAGFLLKSDCCHKESKLFGCCPKGGYKYFLWSRRFWFWSQGRVRICFVPRTLSFCHELQKTLSFCPERKTKFEWGTKTQGFLKWVTKTQGLRDKTNSYPPEGPKSKPEGPQEIFVPSRGTTPKKFWFWVTTIRF